MNEQSRHLFSLIITFLCTLPLHADQPAADRSLNGSWHEQTATRERFCLNGEWQFQPLPGTSPEDWYTPADINSIATVPWDMTMRVPGCWKGSLYPHQRTFVAADSAARLAHCLRAWYRRPFFVPENWRGRNVRLEFGSVGYAAEVFVNRQSCGSHIGGVTPFETDITHFVEFGAANELIVFNRAFRSDHTRPTEGVLTPARRYSGISDDVYLRVNAPVFLDNVFINTSVRGSTITAAIEIAGAGGEVLQVKATVLDGDVAVLQLPTKTLQEDDRTRRRTSLVTAWQSARKWSVDDPHLYHLRTQIFVGGKLIDEKLTRFGFREFWIDGKDFRLNGEIIRLRNFPLIYMKPHQLRPEYLRGWYKLMKEELHHNAIRFFDPYPDICAEIADEVGLLVEEGTSFVDGDQRLRWNWPAANTTSQREIGEWIRAHRNHPSIVIWAAENECWSMKDVKRYSDGDPEAIGTYNWLLGIRDWITAHDDTRVVTYHNLGDMFDWTRSYYEEHLESADLMGAIDNYNVHYPNDTRPATEQAAFAAYWAARKSKPLLVGEFGGPMNQLSTSPTVDFLINGEELLEGGTAEGNAMYWAFRRYVGAWRAAGVSSLGPWFPNLYAVKHHMPANYQFDWDDLTTPHMKPRSLPYENFNAGWVAGLPTYIPDREHRYWDLLADTYSPLLINFGGNFWEHNYTGGETVTRRVSLINDTSQDQAVTWTWTLLEANSGKHLDGASFAASLARSQILETNFTMVLPTVKSRTDLVLALKATTQSEASSHDRLVLTVFPATAVEPPDFSTNAVALYDKAGHTAPLLRQAGLSFRSIKNFDHLIDGDTDVLLIGSGSADAEFADAATRGVFESFVSNGGSLLVLEQDRETYPNLNNVISGISVDEIRWAKPSNSPYTYADILAPGHPIFSRLTGGVSRWRDEYGLVVEFGLRRPIGNSARALMLAGKYGTPMLEGFTGRGRYLISQFKLTARYGKDSEATILMHNLLDHITSDFTRPTVRAATLGVSRKFLNTFAARDLSDDPTRLSNDRYELVIVGSQFTSTMANEKSTPRPLLEFAKQGGTVFILPVDASNGALSWLPGTVQLRAFETQYVFKTKSQSPLIWGISGFELAEHKHYKGESTLGQRNNIWRVPKVRAELHDWSDNWQSHLLTATAPKNWDHGEVGKPVGGIFPTGGSALLETRHGKGRIILCQLNLEAACAALSTEIIAMGVLPAIAPQAIAAALLTNLGLQTDRLDSNSK